VFGGRQDDARRERPNDRRGNGCSLAPLANEYAGTRMLLFEPTQSEQPPMQQQQQIQPENDKKD
jgi:hypothetical protein